MGNEQSMDRVFIKKLAELLEANLENERFGVKELAQEIGISRSQLHRKLQSINGKSASRFIRDYRLGKAMKMLEDNVGTVAEIAYRVGFNSPTYFNTCFHDYYGYPPGEVKYRKPSEIEKGGKDRTSDQEKSTHLMDEKTEIEKRSIRRKLLYASIGVVLIFSISYVFYRDFFKDNTTETLGNETRGKSIAVIPFKNWSGDPELEYISDGMTDAIISRLAKIKSIERVVPFTSMIKYKETDKSIPEIAKELGVQHILQGNFQLSGNLLKINLQLIDGPSDNHFWSDEYDAEWESKEIFKIQAAVAENVAKNMDVMISDNELDAIQKIPTNNKDAYALFLQATFQRNQTTKDSYKNAIPLFERAIALDTNFTEAYVELAEVWYEAGLFSGIIDQKEAWTKAKALSLKVLELDSTNIPIKDLLHFGYFTYDWNFKLAEEYYQTRLRSNDLGRDLGMDVIYPMMTGRYSETLLALDQRISNMPQTIWSYPPKAGTLFLLGRKDEASELLGTCDTLFTHHIYYLQESAKWYYYLEEDEKSKSQLQKYITIFTDRPPVILWLSAVHGEMDGNKESAAQFLSELNKRYVDGSSGSPAWFMALYYCHIRDYESAFDWLQKSYDRHEVELIWLREEPLLTPVHKDSRYLELYLNIGFPINPHSLPE
ncbi:MAG: helix-turn-helix domain-containing protein [Maribacter sp.]|uniref:helix-turn-helix domain-containing protein n=1 Tax=Maribacter sp. TaxID=1897614 RepID=UPI003C72B3B2